ncbi:MAG: rhodanese-like domain-containing protein [Candidatus Marinimicrobia bacterium]|nr:rhodanese-like domain-containing protein [Candidatus Neomarinimicrobiota bacterium]MCF7839680.1 rhodanese-like domain-containing protein [Candidatus Neomarinimicrobiota bacterium]
MRKSIIIATIVLFGAALVVLGLVQSDASPKFPNISAAELSEKIGMNADIVLLDVRTKSEWDGPLGHLDGAKLIPLQEFGNRYNELDSVQHKEIIVYCRSGNRSQVATALLREKGFNAINMLGGMRAWKQLEKPQTSEVEK